MHASRQVHCREHCEALIKRTFILACTYIIYVQKKTVVIYFQGPKTK
jgi:hypothetical protein